MPYGIFDWTQTRDLPRREAAETPVQREKLR